LLPCLSRLCGFAASGEITPVPRTTGNVRLKMGAKKRPGRMPWSSAPPRLCAKPSFLLQKLVSAQRRRGAEKGDRICWSPREWVAAVLCRRHDPIGQRRRGGWNLSPRWGLGRGGIGEAGLTPGPIFCRASGAGPRRPDDETGDAQRQFVSPPPADMSLSESHSISTDQMKSQSAKLQYFAYKCERYEQDSFYGDCSVCSECSLRFDRGCR
jgi:hypothetical protein